MRQTERRANLQGREIFNSLRERLSRRLAHVCSNFERDDLQRLIERMARIEIRYQKSSAVPPA